MSIEEEGKDVWLNSVTIHVVDRHQRRMDVIIKSDHTYVEIMAFIKESE